MSSIYNKFCQGCAVFQIDKYLIACNFIADNHDGSCPCVKCIVKMVCQESQECEEWIKWAQKK